MTFIVAIDGPAGTGKSSVARMLAERFDFIYVDTGAIYRALAFLCARYNVDPDDIESILALTSHLEVRVDEKDHCTKIYIDHHQLDQELRTEQISRLSSLVSRHKKIREHLLVIQRELVNSIKEGAIFEGRDIGTVVFPQADVKIFITANSETRAKRRFDEIKNTQGEADFTDILDAITKRDERDKNRVDSPMQEAKDAIVIDSSTMSLNEVIEKIYQIILKGR